MYSWFFIASFVILIPAAIALARFRVIDAAFKPLAYNVWIGVLAEMLAHLFRICIRNNLYVFNVFMYVDFITFLWLFSRWGAFERVGRNRQIAVVVIFTLLWIWDNCWQHSLGGKNFTFRIAYSMVLLLIAIDQMNNVVIKNSYFLKYNPYLYISVGIIFYYAYSVFISLFNSPLFHPSADLWKWNMLIYVIINVATNLLFAIAFLCMPRKVKFI
ncbi:MAG: hypothetical protein U0X40_08675 [Ferruginibacter sp.]